MYSNKQETVYLVADFQTYISQLQNSIQFDNTPSVQSDCSKRSETYQLFGENRYSLSGQFNSFDLPINVQQSTLENSNLSSSPTSSLDSFKQFDSLNNASLHQPNNKAKLPSVRNSGLVNLNQCVNKSNTKKNLICIFCKNNGESEEIYKSHALKDLSGKVTCPLLMCHQCPVCGATGQNAHTLKYCKKFINSKRIAFLNGEK